MFTDREVKLWRLALNAAASTGEVDTAAAMLIRSMRERNVTPEQLFAAPARAGQEEPSQPDWGATEMRFGKYKGRPIRAIDPAYLFWAYDWIFSGDPDLQIKFGNLGRAIGSFLGRRP